LHGASFGLSDGRLLAATAASDWTIRIWDPLSGELLRKLKGHTHNGHSARFSSDGRFILSSSQDQTARLWDWRKGAPEIAIRSDWQSGVRKARLSPDDRLIATASKDGIARLYDVAGKGAPRLLRHGDAEVSDVVFSANGKVMLTGASDGSIKVWDTSSWTASQSFQHGGVIDVLAITRDGQRAASMQMEGPLRLWSLAESKEFPLPGELADKAFTSIRFTRDGFSALAAAKDGTAFKWHIATGAIEGRFSNQHAALWSATFDPSETTILTSSWDKTARTFDARSNAARPLVVQHQEPVRNAEFSPDGRQIVSASWDRTARISNVDDGRPGTELRGHRDTLNLAVFSPLQGAYVLTASEDKTARLWDVTTGVEVRRYDDFSETIANAEFSSDASHVLVAARDNVVRYWNIDPVVRVAPAERKAWVCEHVLATAAVQAFANVEMKDLILQGHAHLRNPCRPAGAWDWLLAYWPLSP
jgi:WD40 repeat protein